MMEALTGLVPKLAEWADVILATVGLFALIATKTPNKSDDQIVQFLENAINFLGGNFGNAKNSDEVG